MNKKQNLPAIGFGTWQLSTSEVQLAINSALDCGYGLLDTAAAYGNEVAIRKALRSYGGNHDELIVSGKLWNTKRGYDDAIVACKQSLKRLGLDCFGLYLIHWPASPAIHENWREVNAECWRAMEAIRQDGLARAIGVCNYLPHQLDELLKTAKIPPAVNQIELHPGFSNTESLQYCHERDIQVEAWSPLGEGSLLQNETLTAIAAKYNKSSAQICLRWCIQQGTIPLVKSKNPAHISQNFAVFDFELEQDDMTMINALPFSGGAGFDPDTITVFG